MSEIDYLAKHNLNIPAYISQNTNEETTTSSDTELSFLNNFEGLDAESFGDNPIEEEDISVADSTETKETDLSFLNSFEGSDFSHMEAPNLEGIDTATKVQFGVEREDTILGNAIQYAEALGRSLKSEDMTIGRVLELMRDEKSKELFKDFSELRGITLADETDMSIMSGKAITALADPVTFFLPWTKIAKGGYVVSAGVGSAVAAGDAALAEYIDYGTVTPTNVGTATVIGGASGILGAKLYRMSGAGREVLEETATAPAITERVPFEKWKPYQDMLDEIDTGIQKGTIQTKSFGTVVIDSEDISIIENTAKRVISKETATKANQAINIAGQRHEPIQDIRKQIQKLKIKKDKAKEKENKQKYTEQITQLKIDLVGKEKEFVSSQIQRHLSSADQSGLVLNALKEENKLNRGILQGLIYEGTRPVIGGLGGYVASGIIGDEDDEVLTMSLVAAGFGIGQWQKILQRSKLTGIDLENATMVLNEAAKRNFQAAIKINSSGTTTVRMDAMGGWAKVLGNLLLDRPGSATKSVEATAITNQRLFMADIINTMDNSFDDEVVSKVAGEVLKNFTKVDDLKVGYKGITGDYAPITAEQIQEIKRIVPFLRKAQDDLADSVKQAGINFKELDNFGMSQLYNFDLIRKNPDNFYNQAKEAIRIQLTNAGKFSDEALLKETERFTNKLRGIENYGEGFERYSGVNIFQNGKFRPLTNHFERNRLITDPEAAQYLAKTGYMDMDVRSVLDTYSERTMKLRDFARVFGPNGELINYAFRDIDKVFTEAGPKMIKFGNNYKKQITDTFEAFWGTYGADRAYNSAGATGMSVLTTLANTTYLPRVAISSLGDLIQPIQNSGVGAAIKTIWQKANPGKLSFTKKSKFQYDKSFEREYSALMAHGGDPLNGIQNASDFINRKFFKVVQLERVTRAGRSFAFDSGINRAWTLSRKTKLKNKDKVELESYGIEGKELSVLKKYKTAEQAFDSEDGGRILNVVGQKAADRDALIPMVGNRLLFTQSKNPYIRSLGQFLSWAQAKTSQTNGLISRMENGDGALAVRALSLTGIYAGVEWLRSVSNPNYDIRARDNYEPVSFQGAKEAMELSGNWLPWHINKALNMYKYNNDVLSNISPGAGYVADFASSLSSVTENIGEGDVEGLSSDALKVLPLGKEIKGYGERFNLYPTPEDRDWRNTGGILGEEVPNTTQEPEERMDKVTGLPYDVQAGGSNVDVVERSPTLLATLMKRQQQKEQPELGGNLLDRLKRKMENVA